MRVIVCGSRNWTGVYGEARIHTVLNIILALADVLGQKLTIVHGDGPGADQVIDAWAVRREDDGVTVDRFPVKSAAWRQLHKGAGPIRTGPWSTRELTCVLGSCARASTGTLGTLQLAREVGIPTYTVHWTEEVP